MSASSSRASRFAATIAALMMAVGAGTAGAEPLTGDQLRALITGNTLQGMFSAKQLTIAFYDDGTLIGTLGLIGSDRGKYTIEEDLYCQHWVRYFGAEKRCYRWEPQADGYLARNVDSFRTRDFRGRIDKGFPPGF